jgi:hypothetical protein
MSRLSNLPTTRENSSEGLVSRPPQTIPMTGIFSLLNSNIPTVSIMEHQLQLQLRPLLDQTHRKSQLKSNLKHIEATNANTTN